MMFTKFFCLKSLTTQFWKFVYGLGIVREMDALRGEAQEHVQVRTDPLAGISICLGGSSLNLASESHSAFLT